MIKQQLDKEKNGMVCLCHAEKPYVLLFLRWPVFLIKDLIILEICLANIKQNSGIILLKDYRFLGLKK
jgi:hypothetical protein